MQEHHLHHMYQQWIQGNEDYMLRYMDFVKLVAGHNNANADAVMQELQKYHWFKMLVRNNY